MNREISPEIPNRKNESAIEHYQEVEGALDSVVADKRSESPKESVETSNPILDSERQEFKMENHAISQNHDTNNSVERMEYIDKFPANRATDDELSGLAKIMSGE